MATLAICPGLEKHEFECYAMDGRHPGQEIIKVRYFSIYACHPCAGAMLIFSVSFQFLRMTTEVVPTLSQQRQPTHSQLGTDIQNHTTLTLSGIYSLNCFHGNTCLEVNV